METSPCSIRLGLQPGDIGSITYLHGTLYAKEYGWDVTFEAYVAEGLAAFASVFDNQTHGLWIAEDNARMVGSIAIAGVTAIEAQLRWFLLHPDYRGRGLGRRLLSEALTFSRERGYQRVFLWTVSALQTAARLYTSAGFRLTDEQTHARWGALLTEQRYDLLL